ncbi:MAG: hypothetical protein E7114_04195 [Bacteroidales bacterium]|nr:hypothetical protein [Bacteroidales bacterium]
MNYVDAIIEFNNDPNVRKLREFYSSKSFPEILGVSRRELSHSAFLAWLFSSAESHMFGIQPVMQLLELYVKNALEQQRIGSDAAQKLLNPILTRQIDLLSSSVVTEEYVEIAKKKGRADIVISCDMRIGKENSVNKLRIVVENKVYSTEHDNQTEIYYEYYSKCRKSGEFALYIYLYPSSHPTNPECGYFVCITYQDILDSILTPLTNYSNISPRTRFIMEEYINCLSATSDDGQLALSQEEKELLSSFWESHNSLIMAAIAAFADATDDPSIKEASKVIATVNGRRDRDHSKYKYKGKVYSKKTDLVRTVVSDYVESCKGTGLTLKDVKDYFYFQSSMDNVFMDYDEYLDNLRNRDSGKWVGFFGNREDIFRVSLEDDTAFVISNNWPLTVNGKEGEFKKLLRRLAAKGIIVEQV